jgi:hypothetical protein
MLYMWCEHMRQRGWLIQGFFSLSGYMQFCHHVAIQKFMDAVVLKRDLALVLELT